MTESSDVLDRLLAVPPARFVAARNELARDLKKTDAKQAAAIKALAKPSPSVWAINQVARTAADTLAAFLDASDALERAQSGRGGSEESRRAYQAALATQREALDRVVDAARAALTEAGMAANRAVLERVTNNLRWAVPGSEARRLLAQGRLLVDLEPPDFSALVDRIAIVPPAARPRERPPEKKPPSEPPARPRERADGKRLETLRARRASIEETVAVAREQLERARAAQDEAERAATALRRELGAAEKKVAEAERARGVAESTLERQRSQLEQVAAALAQAEKDEGADK
jgi:hypothetical protein